MELVYLWVEEYKNIHRQGFNFSPRFNCDFKAEYEKDEHGNEVLDEEKSQLIICDKKDPNCKEIEECKSFCGEPYIENFFGDNINVTAIVGKNGSGKSSVSEMILPKVPKEKHKKYILIGHSKKDGQEEYHSWGNIKNFKLSGVDNLTTLDIRLGASGVEIGAKDNRDLKHNLFYLNGEESNVEGFDEFKYSDADNNIFVPKYIYQYNKNLHIFKSKNFFYEFDKVRFYLRILNENEIIQEINQISDLYNQCKIKIENYIESLDSTEKFSRNFLISFIRYSLLKLDNNNYEEFIGNITNINNCFEIKVKEFEFIPNINDIVKSLGFLEILELKNETTNRNQDTRHYYEVEIDNKDINSLWIFEYILNLDGLKENNLPILELDLYDSKKELMYAELSQGEKQYIRLLIEVITNKGAGHLSDSIDSKVYIFDEIETSLHPQWQKRIFNDMVNIFLAWTNKKAHLVFLTHSPFLLSDIPKQNIIFLDKDADGKCIVVDGLKEKKQTFGANIHTLLSDSFFMEGGLMGEFAKGKIDEIIKFHKIVEKKKHQSCLKKIYEIRKIKFWNTQSIIGEEYLKQVIKNHLVEIEKILLGKDVAKQEEIARTKEYLKSLEND